MIHLDSRRHKVNIKTQEGKSEVIGFKGELNDMTVSVCLILDDELTYYLGFIHYRTGVTLAKYYLTDREFLSIKSDTDLLDYVHKFLFEIEKVYTDDELDELENTAAGFATLNSATILQFPERDFIQ